MTAGQRAGRAALVALTLAVTGAGCAPAADGAAADGPPFAVAVEPAALRLVNRDTAPVYFTVFEHQMAMIVRWAPCREPSECRSVAALSESRVPFDSIPGYEPGAAAAILYWYQLRPDSSGGVTWDSVRSINLSLPDATK